MIPSGGTPNRVGAGATALLLVCTANICRSPVAAAIAAQVLGSHASVVGSAGLQAEIDQEICPGARMALRDLGLPALAKPHRSRPVTTELIFGAELILTATVAHRDEIGRLDPRARSKVFTIVEAGVLIRTMLPEDDTSAEKPADLRGLAVLLHGNRWRLGEESVPRIGMRYWRRPRPRELSIPDFHEGGARSHPHVFRRLTDAMTLVSYGLSRQ